MPPNKTCSVYPTNSPITVGNPDPAKFKILETIQMGSSVVAKIRYPDCNNFEGIKICAQKRGLEVGLEYAEAFHLIREIK